MYSVVPDGQDGMGGRLLFSACCSLPRFFQFSMPPRHFPNFGKKVLHATSAVRITDHITETNDTHSMKIEIYIAAWKIKYLAKDCTDWEIEEKRPQHSCCQVYITFKAVVTQASLKVRVQFYLCSICVFLSSNGVLLSLNNHG